MSAESPRVFLPPQVSQAQLEVAQSRATGRGRDYELRVINDRVAVFCDRHEWTHPRGGERRVTTDDILAVDGEGDIVRFSTRGDRGDAGMFDLWQHAPDPDDDTWEIVAVGSYQEALKWCEDGLA
jgi:hypothetical protein